MSSAVPGFWMNETSGVLRAAVEAYYACIVEDDAPEMTPGQVAAMRAYLRQWMADPRWAGPMVDMLRTQLEDITTRADIDRWLDSALDEGIDPL